MDFCAACRKALIPASVAVLVTVGLTSARLVAHDIPNDVTIRMFLKPEGQTLRLLVRVPLPAMRDVDYPRRGRDFVNLDQIERPLRDAATLWVADEIEMYEGETRLPYPRVAAVRASLGSDQSFRSFEDALAHVTGPPLTNDTEFVWNQGVLDVLFEYPIQSDSARFSIQPSLARLGIRTVTVLRFLPPGGAVRAFEFVGDPGLVRLDPRWSQAALRFVHMGFLHILDGADHLLFIFCLVIPLRRLRTLIPVVTAFTVAHSITLIASAYDLGPDALWFPPLIETLIATSIVYMALENIVWAAGGALSPGTTRPSRSPVRVDLHRRWLIAFGFGLVHGFGFSFALRQTLQFAGSHLLTSLLSFNLGVELGQVLVIVLLVPALELLFRFVVAEQVGTIILSALVAHTGWHWMTERAGVLAQYRFEWPEITPAFLLSAVRWTMALVIGAAVLWGVRALTAVRSARS
jgi:HupE / UreJ protein